MLLLAVTTALVASPPAEAKKPDKPGTGFKPTACRVDIPFASADITKAAGTIPDVLADDGVFSLAATIQGGFNETRYAVQPDGPEPGDVMCVEVTLVAGSLSDLRVRWLGCENCGLNRATGIDLRRFNNGEIFSAGVSVTDWIDWIDPEGEMTVAVMPQVKTDTATLTVKIGIDDPETS